ncbi:hypothetical protein GGF37_000608 [Kickxella alabastrina]|nr:hypothetical protein GGF37_000608 [Kickxella alabastrina]
MDNYHSHFGYTASTDATAYISTLRYPAMNMAPMMGAPMHMLPSVDTLSAASAAATVSAPAPVPSTTLLPFSSRIGGSKSSSCLIFRYDDARGTSEYKCHQMSTSDGRLFIEHMPNHSVLYIPNNCSVDHVLRDLRKPRSLTKQQKAQKAQELAQQQQQQAQQQQLAHQEQQAQLVQQQYSHPIQYDQPPIQYDQPPMHYDQSHMHYEQPQMHYEQPQMHYDQAQMHYDQPPMNNIQHQYQPEQQVQQPQQQTQAQDQTRKSATSTPAPASTPARKPKEKSSKPINAFIKYRSYKIAELKQQYPEVSQTEISRLAGECWKTEIEDIKNQFRVQYMEEKKLYDLKKASTSSKRSRGCSEAPSDTDASVVSTAGDLTADAILAENGSISAPLPGSLDAASGGLGLPSGFDPKRRRRSLTLPQNTAAAAARAASSSPMLLPHSTKRRRCVTVDMRKQLAAKTSAFMSTPPRIDTTPATLCARSSSMSETTSSNIPHYGPIGVYDQLSFATPSMHPVDMASPQMLGLNANSPYLDMSPMTLPINQTFSLPAPFTSMSPPQCNNTLGTMGSYGPVVGDGSAVAAAAAAAAAAAFELYTAEGDDLVAASLSTLMANNQATVNADMYASNGSLIQTAAPLGGADPNMMSIHGSGYYTPPQQI